MNKPLSDQKLFNEAKKVGRVEAYQKYRDKILDLMEEAIDESQEDYAAFLFAFSSVANEVQRRRSNSKKR